MAAEEPLSSLWQEDGGAEGAESVGMLGLSERLETSDHARQRTGLAVEAEGDAHIAEEETFAFDRTTTEILQQLFNASEGGVMRREHFESFVAEAGLEEVVGGDIDFHAQMEGLYITDAPLLSSSAKTSGTKVLDFHSFLQALGLLASIRYPSTELFSDAMNLLLMEHIFPITRSCSAKDDLDANVSETKPTQQSPRSKEPQVETDAGNQKLRAEQIFMQSPSHQRYLEEEENITQDEAGARLFRSRLSAFSAPSVAWTEVRNTSLEGVQDERVRHSDSRTENNIDEVVELPTAMQWKLRCIFSQYAKLGGIMGSKRNSAAGGGLSWPTVELIHRKRIPKLRMRMDGFLLLVQDSGLLKEAESTTVNSQKVVTPSSRSTSPTLRTKLSLVDILEVFRCIADTKSSRHGQRVPFYGHGVGREESGWSNQRNSISGNVSSQATARSDWESLFKSASTWQQSFVGSGSERNIDDSLHLDFDGFVGALCLLAQCLFLDTAYAPNFGTGSADSKKEYSGKSIGTAVKSLLNGYVFPLASRCEPPIPRLRTKEIEKIVEGTSGDAVGLSGCLPITVDGFARDILSLNRVRDGVRALYNHYSSPAASRLFKKVDAKSRTSNTKTAGKSSVMHESTCLPGAIETHSSTSPKYRLASEQTSEDVNVALWFDAFCALDVHNDGYLQTTHVILMLNRIGLSVPSEAVTDWVRRVGGMRSRDGASSLSPASMASRRMSTTFGSASSSSPCSPSPVESESDSRRNGSVTFAEILAGWSTAHIRGTGHGKVVLDKRASFRGLKGYRRHETSRAGSRADIPVSLHTLSPAPTDFRSSSPLSLTSMSGSVVSASSSRSVSSFSKFGGASGRRSRYAPRQRGRFIGLDVGDFLEFVTDFNLCPKILSLAACRAIFTRRAAAAALMTIRSGANNTNDNIPSRPTLNTDSGSNIEQELGETAISVSCETFAALICDIAHVGFGTYPFDVSVSTFGEKLLVLLWRLQQCDKGMRLIGIRNTNLLGGTALFGELPTTAPTSVDAIRQRRREKRPDLGQQMIGRRMNDALPHERQMWATISSPRSPGRLRKMRAASTVLTAAIKFKGLAKKSNSKQNSVSTRPNRRKKPVPLSQRKRSTWGSTPRTLDHSARMAERRRMVQMSTSVGWDGKRKGPLYNISFDAQDLADSKAKEMGSSPLDSKVDDESGDSRNVYQQRRKRSQPVRPRSTWAPNEKVEVRQYLAAPHKRFNMSIRQIIRQKRSFDRHRHEEMKTNDKEKAPNHQRRRQSHDMKGSSMGKSKSNGSLIAKKNCSEDIAATQQRRGDEAALPAQQHRSKSAGMDESSSLMASAPDESFSGLEGELTDLMAELRDL